MRAAPGLKENKWSYLTELRHSLPDVRLTLWSSYDACLTYDLVAWQTTICPFMHDYLPTERLLVFMVSSWEVYLWSFISLAAKLLKMCCRNRCWTCTDAYLSFFCKRMILHDVRLHEEATPIEKFMTLRFARNTLISWVIQPYVWPAPWRFMSKDEQY